MGLIDFSLSDVGTLFTGIREAREFIGANS